MNYCFQAQGSRVNFHTPLSSQSLSFYPYFPGVHTNRASNGRIKERLWSAQEKLPSVLTSRWNFDFDLYLNKIGIGLFENWWWVINFTMRRRKQLIKEVFYTSQEQLFSFSYESVILVKLHLSVMTKLSLKVSVWASNSDSLCSDFSRHASSRSRERNELVLPEACGPQLSSV